MTFFSHRPQIVVFFLLFSNFPPHHPLFIPKYCEKLSFHPSKTFYRITPYLFQNTVKNIISSLKNSYDIFSHRPQRVLFLLLLFQLSTASPPISLFLCNSSLQNQPFITAHFCASLHVKTSPAYGVC